jgi:hypothetical protein
VVSGLFLAALLQVALTINPPKEDWEVDTETPSTSMYLWEFFVTLVTSLQLLAIAMFVAVVMSSISAWRTRSTMLRDADVIRMDLVGTEILKYDMILQFTTTAAMWTTFIVFIVGVLNVISH